MTTRRGFLRGIGATAALPVLARAQSPGSAITIVDGPSGRSFTYDPATGEDLGNYAGTGFTQRCIRVRNENYPLVVYFRPDVGSSRQEIVFELGTCWNNPTIVDLGPYTVSIPGAGATIQVPKH